MNKKILLNIGFALAVICIIVGTVMKFLTCGSNIIGHIIVIIGLFVGSVLFLMCVGFGKKEEEQIKAENEKLKIENERLQKENEELKNQKNISN